MLTQSVAGVAAMRKSNETVQPRRTMTTPHEMSRLKFERELKTAEKNAEKQAETKLRLRDQQKVCVTFEFKRSLLTPSRFLLGKNPTHSMDSKCTYPKCMLAGRPCRVPQMDPARAPTPLSPTARSIAIHLIRFGQPPLCRGL